MARPDEPPPPAPAAPAQPPPADRRSERDRRHGDRRLRDEPVAVERRSGVDRRQGERRGPRNINAYDLGADELELINAINAHKQRTGRAFPTWSEVLRIVRALGYEKRG